MSSAISAAAGTLTTPIAEDSVGIRLAEIPAGDTNDPRAHLYLVDHLVPGTTITRRIEISTSGGRPVLVHLYPAAATIGSGRFLGSVGRTANDLSSWTAVAPPTLAMSPHSTTPATVRIVVPADAAPGEHYAVVWAEVTTDGPPGSVVAVVNRVGIRIYLSIGPGGPPAAAFTIASMTAQRDADGRPSVLATVHNAGGRALDMSGTLELDAGPAGLHAGPFPAQLGTTLAPGETEPVIFGLDPAIPAGPWTALATLRSGLVEESAQSSITFPAAGAAPAVTATSPAPTWWWPLAAAIGVLVLAVLLRLSWHRRRRARPSISRHIGSG